MYDVVVVGAGASGLGVGVALKSLGIKFTILERHDTGASFARWPKEMRFITPSFPSNEFGMPDLNAITRNTSPAITLKTEHPTGREYAIYLKRLNAHYKLPVQTWVEVKSVHPKEGRFAIKTQNSEMISRYVVWAAGEFQYPRTDGFPGVEMCMHNSTVSTWHKIEGNKLIVIGGYESGMDAAFHLCERGKQVKVFDGGNACACTDGDPSVSLSPFTRDRLARAEETGRGELIKERVLSVEKTSRGYIVHTHKRSYRTDARPILATGFEVSLKLIADLFYWKDNRIELNVYDESTKTPGIYVAGPLIERNGKIFCFIYKFQQRFPVIAHNIAQKMGVDTSLLERYLKTGDVLAPKQAKSTSKKNSVCSC